MATDIGSCSRFWSRYLEEKKCFCVMSIQNNTFCSIWNNIWVYSQYHHSTDLEYSSISNYVITFASFLPSHTSLSLSISISTYLQLFIFPQPESIFQPWTGKCIAVKDHSYEINFLWHLFFLVLIGWISVIHIINHLHHIHLFTDHGVLLRPKISLWAVIILLTVPQWGELHHQLTFFFQIKDPHC